MAKWIVTIILVAFVCLAWLLNSEWRGSAPVPVLFDNMREQARIEDQSVVGRAVPAGVVAHSIPPAVSGGGVVYPHGGTSYLTTGMVLDSFGNTIPAEMGGMGQYPAVKARGEKVYAIHCITCHGTDAGGKGVIADYPEYPAMPDLHDGKYINYPLGQIFRSVAKGQGNMPAYEKRMTVQDIWSACVYLRAMQDEGKQGGNNE